MQTYKNTAAALAAFGFSKPIKAAPKAKAKAAKPVKPAAVQPTPNAKAAASSARLAVIGEHRTHVAKLYNEASLTVHKSKAATLDTYAARVKSPVQKCGPGGASGRDESLLSLIAANAKAGIFDPVALAADAGVISRLASVGYITMRGDAFALTDAGAERNRLIAKRAKAA